MSGTSSGTDYRDHAAADANGAGVRSVNSSNANANLNNLSSAPPPHQYRDYGGNPLAHVLSDNGSLRLAAFGGALQPGLYKPPPFNFGNPVPLGLSGFALTTFLLSMINLGVLDIKSSALVIGPAMAYGGFIQLLGGMW